MTSIVYDYADIRSRMLGEDKPVRKVVEPIIVGVDLGRPDSDQSAVCIKTPSETYHEAKRRLQEGMFGPRRIVHVVDRERARYFYERNFGDL